MKPSYIVRYVEHNAEDLSDLCGEVLATLVVSLDRGNITFLTDESKALFTELVEKWRSRYRQLQTAVRDYPLAALKVEGGR